MCVSDPVQALFRVLTGGGWVGGGGGGVSGGWRVSGESFYGGSKWFPEKKEESFIFTYSVRMDGSD